MRRRLIGTVAITMVWIATLVLMEVVLRVTGRPSAAVIGWTSSGRPGEQNQFGFRGHRFDRTADVRVVLLGDSQVEAYGVALDDMPERQLRRTVSELMGTTVSVVHWQWWLGTRSGAVGPPGSHKRSILIWSSG